MLKVSCGYLCSFQALCVSVLDLEVRANAVGWDLDIRLSYDVGEASEYSQQVSESDSCRVYRGGQLAQLRAEHSFIGPSPQAASTPLVLVF